MSYVVIFAGFIFGVIAAVMAKLGNPVNMGFCIVCFYRDIAGGLGLHRAAIVQYIRPEIPGILLGALVASLWGGEFRARGGSAPLTRFMLGMFMAIGSLVFLGCPARALLRLAGGDLNAIAGILGLVAGAYIGSHLLRRGFNLGRANQTYRMAGWIMPGIMLFLLILTITKPGFTFISKEGPGAAHAALGISIAAGLAVGFLAHRARLCFVGGFRDLFLIKDTHLFGGILGFFAGALMVNLATGSMNIGFANQPIAHTNHLWSFLGMVLLGICATLLGGCPLRQTVLAGEGDTDAAVTIMGILIGTAFSHNFLLASSSKGVGVYGPTAVVVGLIFTLMIGIFMKEDLGV